MNNLELYSKVEIHGPQVEKSVDEGIGDRVGASEDKQAVLQP